MTDIITLPADIVWVTPELGVFVVEGDYVGSTAVFGGPSHNAPQAWAQYDKPCERCNGTERCRDCGGAVCGQRCPDCRDGRQVWTVRWVVGPVSYTHGALLSARATIQVVPVVKVSPHMTVRQFVTVIDGRVILVDRDAPVGQQVTERPLDPLPVPGRDFAVIVRK